MSQLLYSEPALHILLSLKFSSSPYIIAKATNKASFRWQIHCSAFHFHTGSQSSYRSFWPCIIISFGNIIFSSKLFFLTPNNCPKCTAWSHFVNAFKRRACKLTDIGDTVESNFMHLSGSSQSAFLLRSLIKIKTSSMPLLRNKCRTQATHHYTFCQWL